MSVEPAESETLELSLMPKAQLVLGLAAKAAGCSVGEYVLKTALARASDLLFDRRHFGLDAERWTAFMAALDAPARELLRMRQLLREPGVFDSSKPR